MPAIAPSYIYSFFALIIISTLLISSFATYTTTLRTIPEKEQLENLLNHVASEGYKLITLTTTTNSTAETFLQLPATLGTKHYWIKLRNESSKAWVEGSLGSIHKSSGSNRVYLPKTVSASGNYSSDYGPAVLECNINGSTINLCLTYWRENV